MRARHQDRREFLGAAAALVGLTRKGGRSIEGALVNESVAPGHRLRDGASFPAPPERRKMPVVLVGGGIAGLSGMIWSAATSTSRRSSLVSAVDGWNCAVHPPSMPLDRAAADEPWMNLP